ncbi:MAG: U32 family peptidase [Lachnospiraceae bacterium]|nr:U32 family peptidase [Lachnospiraceae bacterium]
MRTVELLSPAGDMDCFMAAVNAGADAIYLGGEAYGARAYASNFTGEEICYAIRYAHLFGIKIYLTVNTLIKEQELSVLADFLMPFYEAGLDGVIVQDFGALSLIKKVFPGLSLHASTQMCITGSYGAALLKEYGVSRIVPARELSIEELVRIKDKTGIEIETFIHGAMCYCYSGQCLFSSFLGGRSGNRGRCAGPCRLPYEAFGHKGYPLSLKDMCTLPILPKLVSSGMDSFKIEGRMKNPYYVAGVTAIYGKYLDLYENCGENREAMPIESVKIDPKDLQLLRDLYVRTELENGYYERHNGKEMITFDKPGYVTGDEKEFEWIKKCFLDKNRQLPITGKLFAKEGYPLALEIQTEKGICLKAEGKIVEKAVNRPVTEDEMIRQLEKTGNTPFHFMDISVIMSKDVFIPIKDLNALRRDALDAFFSLLAGEYERSKTDGKIGQLFQAESHAVAKQAKAGDRALAIHILFMEQLYGILDFLDRVNLSGREVNLVISTSLWEECEQRERIKKCCASHKLSCHLSLPRVFRERAAAYCDELLHDEDLAFFHGFYCGSLDALCYIKEKLANSGILPETKTLSGDFSLYAANYEAVCLLKEWGLSRITAPYELSEKEWHALYDKIRQLPDTEELQSEYLIYGHIPFMQSANCIKKTCDRCNHTSDIFYIKDRMGKNLPVINDCRLCENTIYNSVPVSLHAEWKRICCDTLKISFTIENKKQVNAVLDGFLGSRPHIPADFTKGHYKKGIL